MEVIVLDTERTMHLLGDSKHTSSLLALGREVAVEGSVRHKRAAPAAAAAAAAAATEGPL